MADEYRHKSYRAWLLTQPCCCQPCTRSVIVHHHTAGETEQHGKSRGGKRGKSQRASDADGMPLCNHHHADLHDRLGLSGFFADFDKHSRRAWQDQQVDRLQRLYAMAYPEPLAPAATSSRPKRARAVGDWTVPTVLDLMRKEARHRPAEVSAAFTELADLIEHGKEF